MAVRRTDLLMRVGGRVMEFGTIIKRTSPVEELTATFTRSGTALAFDPSGTLRRVETDEPRINWLDLDDNGVRDVASIALEPQMVTEVEFSIPGGANFPNLNGNSSVGGVLTRSILAVPAGVDLPYDTVIGSDIVRLLSGASGSQTRQYRLGTIAGLLNGLTTGNFITAMVGIFIPHSSEIDPANVILRASDNVTGITSGDAATAKGRWQWLHLSVQVNGSATSARVYLSVEDGDNLSGTNEVMYMAMPTIVDSASAFRLAAPIENASTGDVTQNQELISVPWTRAAGRAMTMYLEYIEQSLQASSNIIQFGSTAGTAPDWTVVRTAAGHQSVHDNGESELSTSSLSGNSTVLGDRVEVSVQIDAAGAVTVSQRRNGGAVGVASSGALPASGFKDWNALLIWIGGRTGARHSIGLLDFKMSEGVYSLADMAAVL